MRVCVFCGSSPGRNGAYLLAAETLGRSLAQSGIGLVYGGGNVGLMGALAHAAQGAGGEVIGVIPQSLVALELANRTLLDLRIVGTMHERKALMARLSQAFVALPGGLGTLEEIFEVWCWAQLGEHQKLCFLLNVSGYFDGLLSFLNQSADEGFISHKNLGLLRVVADEASLIDELCKLDRY